MTVRHESARLCVCATLRKATRSVTQFFDNTLRPSGLRATQFHILAEIHGVGAVTMTALTKTLVMDQTTLTRSLALLKRQGLVKFVATVDGRAKSVELSKKGLRTLHEAQPLWMAAQKKMLSTIGPAAWATLSGELDRLAHGPALEI